MDPGTPAENCSEEQTQPERVGHRPRATQEVAGPEPGSPGPTWELILVYFKSFSLPLSPLPRPPALAGCPSPTAPALAGCPSPTAPALAGSLPDSHCPDCIFLSCHTLASSYSPFKACPGAKALGGHWDEGGRKDEAAAGREKESTFHSSGDKSRWTWRGCPCVMNIRGSSNPPGSC